MLKLWFWFVRLYQINYCILEHCSSELSPHFKVCNYIFQKRQHSEIDGKVDKLQFETMFSLSNDGCIFLPI